ncbi:MAG: OsmC family protein [Promethearchaeota archaeon]
MKFKVTFNQSDLDKKSENNLHRFNTMTVSEDIPPIKIQLPIGYDGPANESNKEIEYTPEDLYLGSLVGCFFTTFSVVSKNSNMEYVSMHIIGEGIMEVVDDVKMMSQLNQNITLTIPTGVSEKMALKVMEIAEKRCPLANSVKTKINNTYKIIFW